MLLNPNLKDFWRAPATYRVLYGGRSSSKTRDAAGMAVYIASKCKVRILCCRQFQNKISESVYEAIKISVYAFGLRDYFSFQKNKIVCKTTGSEFLFYGLWRSIEEIKGLEDIQICWLEEAHAITEEQWNILYPTVIRNEGAQFWVIFNPHLINDFAYRRFVLNPPKNTVGKQINYLDNPFLAKSALEAINEARDEDYELYAHIYLGQPLEDDEQAVIRRAWITSSIDAHKKLGIEPSGRRRIGFDVADAGEDLNAIVYSHGQLITHSETWKGKEDEILKSAIRVWNKALELGAEVVYDSIGVGAHVGSKFNELNENRLAKRVIHSKFNAGGKVNYPNRMYLGVKKNVDMFANVKAQEWWGFADRLKNTYNKVINGQDCAEDDMIFIDSNLPNLGKLIDELCLPNRDVDKAGRMMVESKDLLKKRGIKSPNLADAAIMSQATISTGLNIL